MDRVYSLIGFAQKAGKVSAGTMAAKNSLIRRRARLLVLSSDVSEATRDMLTSVCKKADVPLITLGNKIKLGNSVGKAYRVAVTINDDNLAKTIIKTVKASGTENSITGVVEWPK